MYERAAKSVEEAGKSFDQEFARKVRIINRAWRATMKATDMLNPFKYGLFALELLTHKILRWLSPLFMTIALVSNLLLLENAWVYVFTFVGQIVFYTLAAIGFCMRNKQAIPSVFSIPYYFCLMNLASAKGILEAYLGKTYTTWQTIRSTK